MRPGRRFVRAHEVDWIQSEANYVRLHVGKKSYLLREPLIGLEAKLNPKQFVRVHRSALVNVDRIAELHSLSPTEQVLTLRDGIRVSVSRRYKDHLRTHLGVI